MHRIPTLWKANIIAFCSSFCVMVIELVAARILAPSIGVSLYTWTSIIGGILAGIALGNYLGGKVADKYASTSLLTIILLAGTLAIISILPFSKVITEIRWFDTLHPMLNSTLKVFFIFFLPAIILSMISPMVIKLTLADLGRTGDVVGTIYACSTVGSIVGTFLTGFYFILWFGTRMTVWLVVIVLLLTAILAWFSWRIPERWKLKIHNIIVWALALIIVISSCILFIFRDSWEETYIKESNYFSIQVLDAVIDEPPALKGKDMRILVLDHLVHSYVIPDVPTFLKYDYLQIFDKLVNYFVRGNPNPEILHLGGGGYSFPRFMETTIPDSSNTVIEIDPAVTQVAYDRLGLPKETGIITVNQDARIFLNNSSIKAKYDIVIGDVFNDWSVPYHLTTLECDKLIKASMKKDGVYIINIIDNYYQGNFLPAFVHTLKQTFKYVYLCDNVGAYERSKANTFVVAATDRIINTSDFANYITEVARDGIHISVHSEKLLASYLAGKKPKLLTDDYAPTDALIAPILTRK